MVGIDEFSLTNTPGGTPYIVRLSIVVVNDAPTISGVPATLSANPGQIITFTATLSDPDSPLQTPTFTSSAVGVIPTVTGAGGPPAWVVTATVSASATAGQTTDIAVRATDGTTPTTATCRVTVTAVDFVDVLVGPGMRGGPSEAGTLFTLNPANSATNLTSPFTGLPFYNDQGPTCGFVYNSGDGMMYALANVGGSASSGAIVRFPPDHPEQMVTLYSFTRPIDGGFPTSTPALINGALYGVTMSGGASDHGTIWKFDLATRTLRILAKLGLTDVAGSPPTVNSQVCNFGPISDGSGGLYVGFADGHAWVRIRTDLGDAIEIPGGVDGNTWAFAKDSLQNGYGVEQSAGGSTLWQMKLNPGQDIFQGANMTIWNGTDMGFGWDIEALVHSDSSNQFLFVTSFASPSNSYRGRLVKINSVSNLTTVYNFPANSPLASPFGMQALPMGKLLGVSDADGVSQTLWHADTATYQPQVVLRAAAYESLSSLIGVGPRQGFVWSAPLDGLASFNLTPTLITYHIDDGSATRTTLGYTEGSSPVGAPVALADGTLCGLCTENGFKIHNAGYPGGTRFYRWNPLTGQRTRLNNERDYTNLTYPPVRSSNVADLNLYTVGYFESGTLASPTASWRLLVTNAQTGVNATAISLGETVPHTDLSYRARGASVVANPVATGSPMTVYACSQTQVVSIPVGSSTVTTIGSLPAGSVTVGAPLIQGTTLIACYSDATSGGIARFDLAGTLPVTPTLIALPVGEYFDCTPFVAADGSVYVVSAFESAGGGMLYRFNMATGVLTQVMTISQSATAVLKACPRGTLCQTADGTIWGVATITSGHGLLADDATSGSYIWGYHSNGQMTYQPLTRKQGFGDTFPGLTKATVNRLLLTN
ncbi:MAG: hypothetical protein IPP19_11890 [Verrucomicrobia bacterium]|nr:hypothetical protein [Verrucomicrobiota bacterium]